MVVVVVTSGWERWQRRRSLASRGKTSSTSWGWWRAMVVLVTSDSFKISVVVKLHQRWLERQRGFLEEEVRSSPERRRLQRNGYERWRDETGEDCEKIDNLVWDCNKHTLFPLYFFFIILCFFVNKIDINLVHNFIVVYKFSILWEFKVKSKIEKI